MTRAFICSLFYILTFGALLAEEDISGFWKTINDKTGKPESIVGIYEYQGKYYGRIILTYNDDGTLNDTLEAPKDRAPGVEGEPFYSGLDIIWNLVKENSKFVDGKIIDPEKGRIYDAKLWIDNGRLNVRGELWVFGENQRWPAAQDVDFPKGFQKPDLSRFKPVIPVAKKP